MGDLHELFKTPPAPPEPEKPTLLETMLEAAEVTVFARTRDLLRLLTRVTEHGGKATVDAEQTADLIYRILRRCEQLKETLENTYKDVAALRKHHHRISYSTYELDAQRKKNDELIQLLVWAQRDRVYTMEELRQYTWWKDHKTFEQWCEENGVK